MIFWFDLQVDGGRLRVSLVGSGSPGHGTSGWETDADAVEPAGFEPILEGHILPSMKVSSSAADAKPQKARVLVVDDDGVSRSVLAACLDSAGYRVIEADGGARALELALAEAPALIVIDWMMPGMSGPDTVRELRRLGLTAPILMLTTRSSVDDKVKGLMDGADDFLVKPFEPAEILARIHTLLRRTARSEVACQRLQFGEIVVDLEARTATRRDCPVALSKTEFSILALLAARVGEVVSRELMLDAVWGYTRFPSTRTVDTHIYRLRRKLGEESERPRWIKRVHGLGYVLTPDEMVSQTPDPVGNS